MKLRLLFSTLAAFALLGAGCARTPQTPTASITPPSVTEEAPVTETPAGTTPVAEAPALPPESTAKAPAPTPEPTPLPKPTPAPTPAPVVATPKPKTYTVTIEGFAFGPSELRIKSGDTVTWTQKDAIPHNVVSDEGSVLGSALLTQGQSFSHTFTEKGIFPYHCQPHPRMKATVVVE